MAAQGLILKEAAELNQALVLQCLLVIFQDSPKGSQTEEPSRCSRRVWIQRSLPVYLGR